MAYNKNIFNFFKILIVAVFFVSGFSLFKLTLADDDDEDEREERRITQQVVNVNPRAVVPSGTVNSPVPSVVPMPVTSPSGSTRSTSSVASTANNYRTATVTPTPSVIYQTQTVYLPDPNQQQKEVLIQEYASKNEQLAKELEEAKKAKQSAVKYAEDLNRHKTALDSLVLKFNGVVDSVKNKTAGVVGQVIKTINAPIKAGVKNEESVLNDSDGDGIVNDYDKYPQEDDFAYLATDGNRNGLADDLEVLVP